MTYKLNSVLAKIISPIILVFPDDRRISCKNGMDAVEKIFQKRYEIQTILANSDVIEVSLSEITAPVTNWTGEEQTFF